MVWFGRNQKRGCLILCQSKHIDVANADSTATDIFDESFVAPAGLAIAINASGYLTMTV